MGIRLFRRTYKLGKARALTLPPHWVNFYGSRVDRVLITGDRFLIIAPETMADEASRLSEEIEQRTTLEPEVKPCS